MFLEVILEERSFSPSTAFSWLWPPSRARVVSGGMGKQQQVAASNEPGTPHEHHARRGAPTFWLPIKPDGWTDNLGVLRVLKELHAFVCRQV